MVGRGLGKDGRGREGQLWVVRWRAERRGSVEGKEVQTSSQEQEG